MSRVGTWFGRGTMSSSRSTMPTITLIEISMSRGRVLSDLRRCSSLRAAAEPTT